VADTFVLVDMPGYGYAAVSHKTKEVWSQMIPEYFEQRPQWIHTFLLVDSRHPPQKADQMILNFLLRFTTPFTLILTKVDKISQALRQERTATLSKALKRTPLQAILPFSVDDPALKQNLREYVLSILNG
jgi:GTP-binding protein